MKKIKWHKFTLIALIIWSINSIAEIKVGAFKPYAWALIAFAILVLTSSCSTTHYNYNQAKRKADKMTNNHRQEYVYLNNQIVMFENNHQ